LARPLPTGFLLEGNQYLAGLSKTKLPLAGDESSETSAAA
jgi:hypothetical protein